MKDISTSLLTQINLIVDVTKVQQTLINNLNATFTNDDLYSWINLNVHISYGCKIDYYLNVYEAKNDLEYKDQCDLLLSLSGNHINNYTHKLHGELLSKLTDVINQYEIKNAIHTTEPTKKLVIISRIFPFLNYFKRDN